MRAWLTTALLAFLLPLGVPSSLAAQVIGTQYLSAASSDCTTDGSCATFDPGVVPSVTITVSANSGGNTLQFEATADGVTWSAVNVVIASTGANATSTTATSGAFSFSNAGFVKVRVRCSTYVSGSVRVTLTRGFATARLFSPSVPLLYVDSLCLDQTNHDTCLARVAAGKLSLTGTTPMLLLGGSTSSFSALKRSGTTVQARLADDSAYAQVDALGFSVGGVLLVSTTAASSPSACGTSPAVSSSNGSAVFVVTGGTGGTATGCTVTLPTAPTGWTCTVTNITSAAAHRADRATVQTASTTTSATFEYQAVSTGAASAFTASDVFRGLCFPY